MTNEESLKESFLDLSVEEMLSENFLEQAFKLGKKDPFKSGTLSRVGNALRNELVSRDPITGNEYPKTKDAAPQRSTLRDWSVRQLLEHCDPRVARLPFIGRAGRALFTDLFTIFGVGGCFGISDRSAEVLTMLANKVNKKETSKQKV